MLRHCHLIDLPSTSSAATDGFEEIRTAARVMSDGSVSVREEYHFRRVHSDGRVDEETCTYRVEMRRADASLEKRAQLSNLTGVNKGEDGKVRKVGAVKVDEAKRDDQVKKPSRVKVKHDSMKTPMKVAKLVKRDAVKKDVRFKNDEGVSNDDRNKRNDGKNGDKGVEKRGKNVKKETRR
ncbi:hypothetical protein IEO21_08732 [Rhodonia placenta]|uniref:Uncharacterized protein n=1 Tax=Rhodonia placenta TaxID=104341 RepID=A0A8H7NVV7_9APHY|nr:hypothetical protein IEO21_08732 [Postia placenta]